MDSGANVEHVERLGDILVAYKLITPDQLAKALKVQSQEGGRLGSILFESGDLTMDSLLECLGKQFGVSTANLYQLQIDPEVLKTIPFATMKLHKILPLMLGVKTIFLAMVDPLNIATISEVEFITGKKVQPVAVAYLQMEAALNSLESSGGQLEMPLLGGSLEPVKALQIQESWAEEVAMFLEKMLQEDASDLLLTAGVPPCLKKNNEVIRLPFPPLTPEQTMCYALELMTDQQRERFADSHEADFASTFPRLGRFRINIYRQRHSVAIAIRHFKDAIPGFQELGLPAWLRTSVLKPQGLILVTGPTGHGKTTTLAALIDAINTQRKCNIITIEDPIEYLHQHKASNVNQREVGTDTQSFHEGLKHIFRQAPDVMVIGEMRDPESFAIALEAADTGHLVLSTLHSNSATSTIDRIIEVFPSERQQQIRVLLAESMLLILNQRLVQAKSGGTRVLACEALVNTSRIRSIIREGKTHQIRTMYQQSTEEYQSLDQSLARLCREDRICLEEGLKYCENPKYYQELVGRRAGH